VGQEIVPAGSKQYLPLSDPVQEGDALISVVVRLRTAIAVLKAVVVFRKQAAVSEFYRVRETVVIVVTVYRVRRSVVIAVGRLVGSNVAA
jgi:hypothetical protein